jgi:hypothetical protein
MSSFEMSVFEIFLFKIFSFGIFSFEIIPWRQYFVFHHWTSVVGRPLKGLEWSTETPSLGPALPLRTEDVYIQIQTLWVSLKSYLTTKVIILKTHLPMQILSARLGAKNPFRYVSRTFNLSSSGTRTHDLLIQKQFHGVDISVPV